MRRGGPGGGGPGAGGGPGGGGGVAAGLTALFITRPVATVLLSLGLLLAGLVAFGRLPVAPLPAVDFPTIMVMARLPGASPATMAATVAAPLERRLGEIAGVTELTSTSNQGSTSITVQFDLSRDITGAAQDVQAALNAARADLAVDLPSPPTYRKFNPADAPVMILAVTSSTLAPGQIYDAADAILLQRISQIEGVGRVFLGGGDKPAVRVAVDPARLSATGLSLEQVRATLAEANVLRPLGGFDGEREALTLATNDQLRTAAEHAPLILRAQDGAILRLTHVAEVTDSVETLRQAGWYNRDRAVLVIIGKQPGANVIETTERIHALLPQLQRWMPAGATVSVAMDRSGNIKATLAEVEITLLISILLVVMVVYLTLGRTTPTLAATVTVPLSLAATFGAMALLGYSLDTISLLAIIISVGFVVDDAIVMIENIARHIEAGEEPLAAARKGAAEIVFTVVSITVSLIAVFIPLLFMGGIVGRMFREFAVTLAVAIAASALVSLTVTPTLFAHLMRRARPTHRPLWPARMGAAAMEGAQRLYLALLGPALAHSWLMLALTAGVIGLTIHLYGVVPKGFFPPQDTGMIFASVEARVDIGFRAMAERQQKVAEVILADPAVDRLSSFIGSGGDGGLNNQGRMFIGLKPVEQRGISAQQVIDRLRPKLARVDGVTAFLQPGQDIRVGGNRGRATFQFALASDSLEDLGTWTPKLLERLKQDPQLADLSSDLDTLMPQARVVIDRAAAARLGVDVNSVDQILQDALAERQVATMYTQRNQYKVVLQVDRRYTESPLSLHQLRVLTSDGATLVPLDALARFEPAADAVSVAHRDQVPAATVSLNLAPGVALGEVEPRLAQAAREIGLPPTLHIVPAGNAKAFADTARDQPILIAAALLVIFIVLGMLYESVLHPLTILSTLPSAGLGALLALLATGTELSLISMIGLFLLLGIVKKNGILLVDFAITAERAGATPLEAIRAACATRFRPITMTTLTALLGALPLALASGPIGALRQPLGIAIVGGLMLSHALTLFTTPVIYLTLARLSRWRRTRRQPNEEVAP